MSHNEHIAATPASGDARDVAVTGHFKGARLIHPTLSQEEDHYYSYREGAHHWWWYLLDPTYGGVWSGVDFDFVKTRSASFDDDAIWLGEHFDASAAANEIQRLGYDPLGDDSTQQFIFLSQTRSRVEEILNGFYVAGLNAITNPSVREIGADQAGDIQSDTTIVGLLNELIVTSIDRPSNWEWAEFKHGDLYG